MLLTDLKQEQGPSLPSNQGHWLRITSLSKSTVYRKKDEIWVRFKFSPRFPIIYRDLGGTYLTSLDLNFLISKMR